MRFERISGVFWGLLLGCLFGWQPGAFAVELRDPVKIARVVIVEQFGVVESFHPDTDAVAGMIARGMTNFTRKATVNAAWLSLVTTNDRVGIKVYSTPGSLSGTRAAVVEGMIRQLLAAGVPATNLIVWDKRYADLVLAGYLALGRKYGVVIAGASDSEYDDAQFYENPLLGKLVWGDHEFGKRGLGVGRKSFVSKLVTQRMTKIINVSPMLSHNAAGVSGNFFSLALGSVDNTLRFDNQPDALLQALPEIYALPILADRVVLNVVDGLVCQYEGEEKGLLHYSTVLNQLRFSKDPVALDVLSFQEITRLRGANYGTNDTKRILELYSNASLLELGISDPKLIRSEMIR